MTVFERVRERVIVLLSSGNLAGTQAVISVLKQRADAGNGAPNLWNAQSMFETAMLVSDAMRDVDRRDGEFLEESDGGFNASFILEPPRQYMRRAALTEIRNPTHEDSPRLRNSLRVPAADSDDIDVERALLAYLRPHGYRPPHRGPARAAHHLS